MRTCITGGSRIRGTAGALALVLLLVVGVPRGHAEGPDQARDGAGPGATAAAVASDVVYVPGKAIVCTASGVLWIATMVVTLGSLYNEAANLVKGGCGGRWVLTGEDIKPAKSY